MGLGQGRFASPFCSVYVRTVRNVLHVRVPVQYTHLNIQDNAVRHNKV